MLRTRPGTAVLVLLVLASLLLLGPLARSEEGELTRADELFEQKNYAEAAKAYEALLASTEDAPRMRHASRRVILCELRLQRFDPALEAAETYLTRVAGTPFEARAERLAGNLWMKVPHWGTRAGGTFHRAQWLQGIPVRSIRHDKTRALEHLEKARDLYAWWDQPDRAAALAEALPEEEAAHWHEERLGGLFDLAGACGRFGIYENAWIYWYGWWSERDDFLAETAGEDDFDEYHSDWQLRRKRPIGLRLGPDGTPIFPSKPAAWADDLSDDRKILWLLAEIRDLDRTDEKRFTALSFYRQAMLARARFGMDRLNQYAGIYRSEGRFPLQEDLKSFDPWTMKDGEAIVLAGGRITKVDLPPQFDVFGLLRIVVGDYAASGVAPQAQYAQALYHQSRQQYVEALGQYALLQEHWPEDDWSKRADGQIKKIRAPQVHVNQTGVQLPGQPARLQVSHRNTSKLFFVARRIDLEGFFREIRDQEFDVFKGPRDVWALQNWSQWFTQDMDEKQFACQVARRHLGEEVARWADEVVDDGTHRYARSVLQTPIDRPGAFLVQAFLEEPSVKDEKTQADPLQQGDSRAAVVLTDLAIVEKPAKDGRLFFIADAETGSPVAGATIDLTEFWSVWERKTRKRRHYRATWQRTTDEVGLALDERPKRRTGQLHVVVKAGEGEDTRLAWSGMHWWNRYSPSHMQEGIFAYCITDRPVYRPNQTVRFKVWVRQKRAGVFENAPGKGSGVSIYDPRGNEVFKANGQTDDFGGFDGEFTLAEEPKLGVWRLTVRGANWHGGANFRVEEYKKPEFEVTVEPGATHTKLGDTITAKIEATYYFGGPVTNAEVRYKVFREEYRHAIYPPGAWDWLYGPGYGYAWYAYDWFPWWGWVRCCRVAPVWWWGYFGYGGPARPVRELVQQGEGRIGEDGTLDVEVDTASALRVSPDRDHRYVIQAEVRDASRRVITGEGAVKVTRQAYYATVYATRGWYRPGEEIVVQVRCTTPDGQPVEAEGMVTISEAVFGGPGNARLEETEIDRWKASTDERGLLELRLRPEKSGQFEIAFEAPDTWGGVVKGYGVVWVCGEDFDGRLYRFNDLELLTDKRTYRPGDVAHVMINTRRTGSWVLFGDQVDQNTLLSWKMLHLPRRNLVVDVPIEKGDVPDFFVEATTVADTRVHQQVKRICVPPEDGLIDVTVTADKPRYEPGEKATISVTATTLDGEPAEAQVAISAFDKSILYIQPEYTPPIRKFFHGNLRHHQTQGTTNLVEQFASWGWVSRPFEDLRPLPPAWWGLWGPRVGDWRTVDGDDFSLSGAKRRLAEESGPADEMADAETGGPGVPGAAEGTSGRIGGPDAGSGGGAGGRLAGKQGAGAVELAEAEVRTRFADTALWQTTLTTGADGRVEATVDMPENLTTWKIGAWGMTKDTQVGQASTSAITTKNLLVRLQAPRFFMEYDEVVLSANVHNYLEEAKTARVSIRVSEALLEMIGDVPATVDVDVPAGGEARVDWRVKVRGEGRATITVEALTDDESDAMQLTFPVLVHGMSKQVATTGSMRPDEVEETRTVELVVPEKRRPELTQLEVRFAPSLIGAMLDAVPYCLDYPYGCTEQTMSRFLPAVLTLKTLRNLGIDLEDVKEIRRGRMEEIRRIEEGERIRILHENWASPVFDDKELGKIVQKGLERIRDMQRGDGGWGWWTRDDSSPYMTSYVLQALLEARGADVDVDDQVVGRGLTFLEGWEQGRLRNEGWAPSARHAFVAYVLSMAGRGATIEPAEGDKRASALIERLWLRRDELNLYGKSLLSLALVNLDDEKRARTVLQNILQYLEENEETQVAWLRTPDSGWWFWWNNDIETNAWALRALVRLEPKSDVAPRIVKWLLNNRKNGYYWRSTRDTTLCIAAMSDFVRASGEGEPEYTVRFDLDDGAVVKEVRITKTNFFTYDNRFVVEGVTLGGGTHTLKITKTGPGALYFNTYLRYFTKEEHITAAGHELKVDRTYYLLKQIPYEVEVEGSEGQTLTETRLRYERVELKDGDAVESGDVIQVELRVTSDNDYTYLAFEDMKPAGCEPTELRSGGKGQEGFWSYMELRDEKVVFFVGSIGQGEHLLRYRLRAEIPGIFHALPAKLFAMYVPELRANSEEMLLKITDR